MNVVTEANIAGRPVAEKPRARPVRMVRWFVIVGCLLAVVAGGIVYFEHWRSELIKNIFANNRPPPATVTVVEAK